MIKELGQLLVNAYDDDGCTALMCAVQNANIKCVESLIANGADMNIMNNKPSFPLKPTHKITDMYPYYVSPLIDSINLLHPNSPHSCDTMMEIFDLLLDSGADVNFYDQSTNILYAALAGNVNCVKKLIQKGAQINYKNRDDQKLWTIAAKTGRVELMKFLLEDKGFDKNSIDEKGFSILYWAVHFRNIETVRYLLDLGVTITSFEPQECVEACADCGTNIICHHLNRAQLTTDPYMIAIRRNKPDFVRLMDEYGCELGKSTTILSYAIVKKSVDVVDYLLCNYKYPLNYGYAEKFIDKEELNSCHQTFLKTACQTQSIEVVKLLLEHGADPNIKVCEENRLSVINVAIFRRYVEITACLIRAGVNVNTRSSCPNIGVVLPFEVAFHKNRIYAAEMLLIAGCSRGEYSLVNNSTLKANTGREMEKLLKEWNVHMNNVLPLEQRCRMVILNHLSPQADKITELPLPPILIRYLSIPELDDIVEKHLGANH